jgi:HK97 family phage major capsid protein
MRLEEEGEEGKDSTYRVVDWEPLEVSIVSIPADDSVGIGRNAEGVEHETVVSEPEAPAPVQQQEKRTQTMDKNENGQPTPVDAEAVVREYRAKEMTRINDLEKLGNQYAQFDGVALARKCISEGSTVADFQARVLENANKQKPAESMAVGLSDNEVKKFSFLRVINALANPSDRKAQEAAAFEFEASRAASEKYGRTARGVMLPYEVMTRADLTTSTGGTEKAGYLVPTDHQSFIDALRNRMVTQALGAQFLTGLSGTVAIPRLKTATLSYWVAENVAPTEGAPVFDQVTLSPKTIGAYVDFSRRLMLQASPDVEGVVRGDLSRGLAVGIDAAAIAAGGTSKPTGVLGTSGIGSVTLGTNGAAPDWAMVVKLIKEVEVDNAANGSLAFLTNPKVVAALRQTTRQATGVEGNFIMGEANSLLGYPVMVSNQCPSTLSKGTANGTLSAMIFGNWSELMIGMWGGVDLTVDPYTGSSAGTVRVVALADVDVAVRHAESFAECNEIIAA